MQSVRRRGWLLSWAIPLVGGCTAAAPAALANQGPAPTTSVPVASAPEPQTALPAIAKPEEPRGFVDPDALPAGALARLGSRKFQGTRPVAVADDGRVASLGRQGFGVFEHRADGFVRRVANCHAHALAYAGDQLIALCDNRLVRLSAQADAEPIEVTIDCSLSGALSPNGKLAACVRFKEDRSLWLDLLDVATQRSLWTAALPEAPDDPRALELSDSGAVFVAMGEKLHRFEGAQLQWSIQGHYDELGYNGARTELLAWAEETRELSFFRATNGKLARKLTDQRSPCGASVFLQDGSWLTARMDDPNVLVWSEFPSRERKSFQLANACGPALSANGRFAAVAGDGIMRIELASGKRLGAAAPLSEAVSLVSSPKGDRMLQADNEGQLRLYDMRRHVELVRGPAPRSILRGLAVAFSEDENYFAIANAYGALQVLETTTLKPRCELNQDGAAHWLFWRGATIVAVDGGNPADDEQFHGGAVTILDRDCKVHANRSSEGLVSVLEETKDHLDLFVHPFEDPEFDPRPSVPASERVGRAWRVSLPSGALSAAPAEVLQRATTELALAKARWERGERPATSVEMTSSDRTTSLRVEEVGERSRRIHCRDKASGKERVVQLPDSAWRGLSLGGDGSWFAVPEDDTTLIYPCRPEG
jgi:hypothetical protein